MIEQAYITMYTFTQEEYEEITSKWHDLKQEIDLKINLAYKQNYFLTDHHRLTSTEQYNSYLRVVKEISNLFKLFITLKKDTDIDKVLELLKKIAHTFSEVDNFTRYLLKEWRIIPNNLFEDKINIIIEILDFNNKYMNILCSFGTFIIKKIKDNPTEIWYQQYGYMLNMLFNFCLPHVKNSILYLENIVVHYNILLPRVPSIDFFKSIQDLNNNIMSYDKELTNAIELSKAAVKNP